MKAALRSALRAGWVPGLVFVACAAAASFARYGLIEPADLTGRCDAAPWGDLPCAVRTVVVQTFIDQRVGFAALGCGLAAVLLRRRWLAWLGLGAGALGLVLYSSGPAAPGALLAALGCARSTAARAAPR